MNRYEKIEKLKNIMNGKNAFELVYVLRANDGNYYRERDITSVHYEITFTSEVAFRQWQFENGLENTAYSPDYSKGMFTVPLKTDYEPIEGARPSKKKIMFWDEDFTPPEAFQKREDTRNRLCTEYLKHPPKGFTVTRKPYIVAPF